MYNLIGGFGIGLPPVLHFGSEELKQRVVGPCLRGEERICLAITEPEAGSDVANIVTTAVRDPDDPEYYIVNGVKKWCTGESLSCPSNLRDDAHTRAKQVASTLDTLSLPSEPEGKAWGEFLFW